MLHWSAPTMWCLEQAQERWMRVASIGRIQVVADVIQNLPQFVSFLGLAFSLPVFTFCFETWFSSVSECRLLLQISFHRRIIASNSIFQIIFSTGEIKVKGINILHFYLAVDSRGFMITLLSWWSGYAEKIEDYYRIIECVLVLFEDCSCDSLLVPEFTTGSCKSMKLIFMWDFCLSKNKPLVLCIRLVHFSKCISAHSFFRSNKVTSGCFTQRGGENTLLENTLRCHSFSHLRISSVCWS